MDLRTVFATGVAVFATACGRSDPAPPPSAPTTITAATCPCALADGGAQCGPGMMMHGGPGMMGPGHDGMMGPAHDGSMMMHGGLMGGPPASTSADAPSIPLSADAKSALLRALDEEYRAEALYAHVAAQLGAKPPLVIIARAEHRHAWVLESLALAHGVELPANKWPAAKQADFANVAAACRAGADSEKKTIALYDELLKIDLPTDLRRAFTNLRAASAERHLPAFEGCR